MKIKTLLIATSLTAFLFTSCEKNEMEQDTEQDKGTGAGGGGMQKATNSPIITLDSDVQKNYPDSLYTFDDKLNY